MPFEGDNLRITVMKWNENKKEGLRSLVLLLNERKEADIKARRSFEPTVIYCMTTYLADELYNELSGEQADKMEQSKLQGKKVPDKKVLFRNKVVRYNPGSAPPQMREDYKQSSHNMFLQDDAEIMVATWAYSKCGLTVKRNIRHIIHWGTPRSLEEYCEQVGRAGRDGAPAHCLLLHAGENIGRLNNIVQPLETGQESFEEELNTMQAFCWGTTCRHAFIADYLATPWEEATTMSTKACRGGCDICDARKANEIKKHSVGPQVAALLQVVHGVEGPHDSSIDILVGNTKAEEKQQYRQQLKDMQGQLLLGRGKAYSEDWWRGLQGLLIKQGYLIYETREKRERSHDYETSYSALCITSKGCEKMNDPSPLDLDLPPSMYKEAAAVGAKMGWRERAADAGKAKQEEAAKAEAKLLEQLKVIHKEMADLPRLHPECLVKEETLQKIARLRPSKLIQLSSINVGMTTAASERFGEALLAAVKKAVQDSPLLIPHSADICFPPRRSSSSTTNNRQPLSAIQPSAVTPGAKKRAKPATMTNTGPPKSLQKLR